MAPRLVVLSDMWGAKKGLWITSYLGYLQQYFNIVYYDVQQLSGIEVAVPTRENLCNAFIDGGRATAVAQILKKETEPSSYLTFCAGGTIVWEAALKGLPVKSLYAVSPMDLHLYDRKPDCPISLLYGERHQTRPDEAWLRSLNLKPEIIPDFGCELYSDEKIIQKICLDLLEPVLNKQFEY